MSNKLYKCNTCGKKKQESEFYTQKDNRDGKTYRVGKCKSCTKIRKQELMTPEHAEKKRQRDREYSRKLRSTPEGRRKLSERTSNWQKRNRAACTAATTMRRAKKLERTPKWLTASDISTIKSIYKMARALSKKTGIPHHVDHVIPLQGKLVSGLHCPTNLQVIPASENWSKNNKYSV